MNQLFQRYIRTVDARMQSVLDSRQKFQMYDMMRYFLGFTDEQGNPLPTYGGKRIRAMLCMVIADAYGGKEQAVNAAASIELFHNFTLIHDDIEDHDELRRGRSTVWKLWGVNHAINTGDAQSLLALLTLGNVQPKIVTFLQHAYLEVIEGQFLDFTLANAAISSSKVSQEVYARMISKKTAALVSAAAAAGGMVAEVSDQELEDLKRYGKTLGLSYQIYDDWASIWGNPALTGKAQYKDIIEKKKSLPIIILWEHASLEEKYRLAALYEDTASMGREGVRHVLELLKKYGIEERVLKESGKYLTECHAAVEQLTMPEKFKKLLHEVVEMLIPSQIVGKKEDALR